MLSVLGVAGGVLVLCRARCGCIIICQHDNEEENGENWLHDEDGVQFLLGPSLRDEAYNLSSEHFPHFMKKNKDGYLGHFKT